MHSAEGGGAVVGAGVGVEGSRGCWDMVGGRRRRRKSRRPGADGETMSRGDVVMATAGGPTAPLTRWASGKHLCGGGGDR